MQIGEKYNCSGENFRGLLALATKPRNGTLIDINPCCIQRYKFMSIGRRVQEISLHKVTPKLCIPVLASEGLPRRV